MIIYAICGLPGSGKTHLIESLKKNSYFTSIIDDIDSRIELYEALNKGGRIIVSDPYLVEESSRQTLERICFQFGAKDIRYFFFENSPDKCYDNVVNRNDGRIISKYFIDQLSKRYTIPPEHKAIPVWTKAEYKKA